MTKPASITLCGLVIAAATLVLDSRTAYAGMCFGCGSNAATLGDDVQFDELNVNGLMRGDVPVKLVRSSVTHLGTTKTVQLKVLNEAFSALATGTPAFGGDTLREKELTLEIQVGTNTYQIRLFEYHLGCTADRCVPLGYWVEPQNKIPHYVFRVRKLGPVAPGTGTGAGLPGSGSSPTGSGGMGGMGPRGGSMPRSMGTGGIGGMGPRSAIPGSAGAPSGGGVPDRAADVRLPEIKRDTPWEGTERFLCRGAYQGDAAWAPAAWGAYANSAIIFQGDEYDPKKNVVRRSKPGWFNLACAGTAIYKMHLLRHTGAGQVADKKTTLEKRTAMLKAIRADYCGDGKAWTGDGTPLYWTDAHSWFPPTPADFNLTQLESDQMIEAIWSKNGAICLNTPRRLPKIPNPVWDPDLTHPNRCTDPAVRRTEVVSNCAWLGQKYQQSPPLTPTEVKAAKAEGKKVPTTIFSSRIPPCNAAWMTWWKNRNANGDNPYVLTANVKGKDANYCDPP